MDLLTQSIMTTGGADTAYIITTAILGVFVVFAVWRGRVMTGEGVVVPLYFALLAFVVSRIMILDSYLSPLGVGPRDHLLFTGLCLASFYVLNRTLRRLVWFEVGTPRSAEDTPAIPEARGSTQFLKHSSYFAAFAAFVYLLKSPPIALAAFTVNLVNYSLVAATIPMVTFVFVWIGRVPRSLKGCVFASVSLFTASWALFEIAMLSGAEWSPWAIATARMGDIIGLFILLVTLVSNYVRLGVFYQALAAKNKVDMNQAKGELAKLNEIAANMYEDSAALIKKQKEQTLVYVRKVESLEKILRIGILIQQRHRLDELLQMVVELVRDNLGFKTVTLRLFNQKAQTFETSAHVGLSDETRDTVANYRIPLAEYRKMIEPRFRISNSYFIRHNTSWYGDELEGQESMLVEDTWDEIDMLLTPLVGEGEEPIGYLSVENPATPTLEVADVIESLENIAALAVTTIRNARFLKELESKNHKLRVYADKLAGLNKLKSNFVATISHEFRTPLTSIKAYCDTLLANVNKVNRDLLRQFLVVIDEESGRLMTLIEDILDFSQMESGALRFERAPCNLTELSASAARELEKNYESKGLTLHRKMPAEDVMVQGDRGLLKQMMVNLLHNASKFTKQRGGVWLTVEDTTASVRIAVEDEGIGIPDDQLEKIFEQFHQVDSSNTRKHGGSGLGLAICKNITEWHEGRIWVENLPGRGARFVVVLPKKQAVVRSHVIRTHSAVRRFEVERLLELLVDNIAEFMQVRKTSIMLLDRKTKELRIECALGLDENIVESARVKLGEGISGRVAKDARTLLVTDIEADERVSRSNNEMLYGSRSFLSVPILSNGEVTGVVNVASPIYKPVLEETDGRLLEMLVERVSTAIDKLKDFTRVSGRYEQVRETFKAILDSKRFIDSEDEELMIQIATKTAQKLGLDQDEVAKLKYAMHVYDLGLSKIGYHIIKKPTDLLPNDRKEIERHTNLGTKMLSVLESDPDVRNVVLYHHENFDGSGYPGQLKGEAIPIEARIVRVTDSLRALISRRPYQRQYSLTEAMDVIKHRAGVYFDPEVVDVCVEVMKEFENTPVQDESEIPDDVTIEDR